MTILADWQIRNLCTDPHAGRHDAQQGTKPFEPMIEPFIDDLVEFAPGRGGRSVEGVVSYGLTSYGYDFRAGNTWYVFTSCTRAWRDFTTRPADDFAHRPVPLGLERVLVIDPKKPLPEEAYEKVEVPDHEAIVIPPRGYALTHSKEYVRMPRDVNGTCLGKSTYARVGIHLNVTPLEAGWHGQVTIELANSTEHAIKVYAGEGIMQVQFAQGAWPKQTYADRKGKYQGQTGVTPHKVRGT